MFFTGNLSEHVATPTNSLSDVDLDPINPSNQDTNNQDTLYQRYKKLLSRQNKKTKKNLSTIHFYLNKTFNERRSFVTSLKKDANKAEKLMNFLQWKISKRYVCCHKNFRAVWRFQKWNLAHLFLGLISGGVLFIFLLTNHKKSGRKRQQYLIWLKESFSIKKITFHVKKVQSFSSIY